jgi:hypothetical protein
MKTLPTFRLIPEPVDDAARTLEPFKWAPADVGTRHQLGGEPAFLQAPEWPACSACRQPMSFYGQLDAINDQYVLADCGLIYVFVCFDDYEVKSILQSG